MSPGTTVVTHQGNREYYENVVFSPAPWTLEPDRLAAYYPYFANNRTPAIETVNQKYVLSDGVRTMDLYPVQGTAHNSTMLMVYLPKERILVNADLWNTPAQGAQPPAAPTPGMITLQQNIQRLKLDVARHVPIHGPVATMEDFSKIVGKTAEQLTRRCWRFPDRPRAQLAKALIAGARLGSCERRGRAVPASEGRC